MTAAPETTSSPSAAFGGRAVRGVAVTMGGQVARMAVQLLSVVILSRLLTPDDYGLFAMVMAIAGISEIFRDFGLSNAAIQAPTLSTAQRDKLFWVNSGIGLALGLVVLGLSFPIAAVYRQPELTALTQVMAIAFALNGVTTQHQASLSRMLRFGSLALVDVLASVGSLATAIVLAVLDFGYWALAWQLVAQSFLTLVLSVAFAGWMPRLPRRDVSLRGFYRFGWNMVSSQLVNYAANNTDALIIGLRFGPTDLGIYRRGFQLLMNPLNQLRSPISRVAVPVLSRVQDEHARFNRFITTGQIALGYSLVAGLAFIAGASDPIVRVFLGPQWVEAGPVLRFLAIAGAFSTLAFVGYWVYVSRGLTAVLFRFTLMSASMKVLFVVIGSQWGIVGIAAGFALEPILSWPLSIWWLSRATEIPRRALLIGVVRLGGLGTLAGFAAWGATIAAAPLGPVLQMAAALIACLLAYALFALVLPPVRRDIRLLAGIVRSVRRSGIPTTPAAVDPIDGTTTGADTTGRTLT
jgi:PST family polysaccharide transporter